MVKKFRSAYYSMSGMLISPKICVQFNVRMPKTQKNEFVCYETSNATSEMKHLEGQLSYYHTSTIETNEKIN